MSIGYSVSLAFCFYYKGDDTSTKPKGALRVVVTCKQKREIAELM
jgi:hypothetical protein